MKLQSICGVFALLCLSSCQDKASEVAVVKLSPADSVLAINPSASHPFLKVSVGLKADFEQAKSLYKDSLNMDSSFFVIGEQKITLNLPFQKPYVITSSAFDNQANGTAVCDADFTSTYDYLGYHNPLGVHVVRENMMESISYILVHAGLGILPGPIGTDQKYGYFSSLPKFSPNSKWLMDFPDGNNATDDQRTFVIYKNNIEAAQMGGGRFVEVGYELTQPDLVVLDAYWLDDHTVLAKASASQAEFKETEEKDFFYVKISLP